MCGSCRPLGSLLQVSRGGTCHLLDDRCGLRTALTKLVGTRAPKPSWRGSSRCSCTVLAAGEPSIPLALGIHWKTDVSAFYFTYLLGKIAQAYSEFVS